MNVLSLFDGMSCGQLALNRLGIEYDTYYASEIDKYAIKVTQANYPNTIQIGDVTQIKADDFGDEKIDLILAGSPCQGFSFAGKQLNFDDPRSKLFFEFVRLVRELKPKYFLLENVNMKKEYKDIITKEMGVEPIDINSSLLSAQNRRRLYWTNIPNVTQPKDKGIVLRDILLSPNEVADMVANQGKKATKSNIDKSHCLLARDYKGFGNQAMTGVRPATPRDFDVNAICHHVADADDINGHASLKRVYGSKAKSPTVNTCTGGNREPKVLVIKEATKKGYTEIQEGDCFDFTFPNSKTRRGRNMKDKSNCLTAANYDYMVFENKSATKAGKAYSLTASYGGAVAWNSIERKQRTMVPTKQSDEENPNVVDGYHYRKLTPLECERLQTVPDNYTNHVSNSQRYKMLGNGWTIDVIAHILSNMDLSK